MTTSYSESELADIALVKTMCLLTPEKLEPTKEFFNEPTNTTSFYLFFVSPSTSRCSDGKRRSGVDYLEFLFPDPDIEDLVAASNTEDRAFNVSLDLTNPQYWKVICTRK